MAVNFHLHAQWEVQLDLQNFTWLGNIHFIDENRGWAIGGNGHGSPYFYTTDGGENWYLDDDWWNIQGTDIVFVNPDTGFIATQDGIILKTINGGETWTDIQTPATQDIMRLFFVDENNGWATLGSYSDGHILKSENSGDSWEILYPAIDGTQSIYFLDSNIGWLASWLGPPLAYGVILKTNNGGDNFITQYNCSTHKYFEDICFFSEQIGWAVGQKSSINTYFIIKTEDGGETWEEDTLPVLTNWYGSSVEACIIYSIQFVNDTLGWLTCADENSNGYILLTKNGGEIWQQQYNYLQPIFDIQMLNVDTGWAIGGDFIHYTTNGDTIIIVGVEENLQEKNLIRISPNPANDKITVSLPFNFETVNLRIFDMEGKCVLSQCHIQANNSKIKVGTKEIESGIYLLQAQTENRNYSTKFIINKRGTGQ